VIKELTNKKLLPQESEPTDARTEQRAAEPGKKGVGRADAESVRAPVVPLADRQAEKKRFEDAKYVSGLLTLAKHLK
jgi:hypothetical protein